MREKAHAEIHANRMHTLRPQRWPAGDHRKEWKWAAYIDGTFWTFFKRVSAWRMAASVYHNREPRGPHAEATDRAVLWSEFEGRQILERLEQQALNGGTNQ
jgi:hypothetical protein